MRVHHHKLYEKLSSIFSNNEDFFHTVILNFITDMSSAKNLYTDKTNDNILIFVNKLTKHATYVAITKNFDAENFADVM